MHVLFFLGKIVTFNDGMQSNLQKRTKKDKVRPILVNKDVSPENLIDNVVEVPPANHFETLHPKDEFELMHTVS